MIYGQNAPHHYFSKKHSKKHRVKPLINEYGIGYNHKQFIAQSYTIIINADQSQFFSQ
jgi:hypothetical protein